MSEPTWLTASYLEFPYVQGKCRVDGDQPHDKIIITSLDGEVLSEHTRPTPGIRYVGNSIRPTPDPKNDEPSPKS